MRRYAAHDTTDNCPCHCATAAPNNATDKCSTKSPAKNASGRTFSCSRQPCHGDGEAENNYEACIGSCWHHSVTFFPLFHVSRTGLADGEDRTSISPSASPLTKRP
jgi:hypothetical protein